ncbi:hypothetical protein D5687_08735 [Guyparkeria sp. SCN-R1]|nr:hypothetical protein D5687_08735 [Guyparkeria sp. SCN-R1]
MMSRIIPDHAPQLMIRSSRNCYRRPGIGSKWSHKGLNESMLGHRLLLAIKRLMQKSSPAELPTEKVKESAWLCFTHQ